MRRQACIPSQHVVSKPHTWLRKTKLENSAHLASSPYWAGLLTKSMVHAQTLVARAYLVLFFLNFECWFDLGCFLVSFFVCTYNYILLLIILFYCGQIEEYSFSMTPQAMLTFTIVHSHYFIQVKESDLVMFVPINIFQIQTGC